MFVCLLLFSRAYYYNGCDTEGTDYQNTCWTVTICKAGYSPSNINNHNHLTDVNLFHPHTTEKWVLLLSALPEWEKQERKTEKLHQSTKLANGRQSQSLKQLNSSVCISATKLLCLKWSLAKWTKAERTQTLQEIATSSLLCVSLNPSCVLAC